MIKYGIFGLTGDPCTYAHYEIVRKVIENEIVDKVIIIPTIVDYYRKDKERMFTNEQRLEIIRKWFDDCENVIIDDFEYILAAANKTKDSKMILEAYKYPITDRRYWHMLQDAIMRYGKNNEYLTIVGSDSWNNITSWFNFRELGKATKFIVVNRKNDAINFYVNYPELHSQPYKVLEIDKKFENMSASDIRRYLTETCNDNIDCFNSYLKEIDEHKNKTNFNSLMDIGKCIKMANKNINNDELLLHTEILDVLKAKEIEEGFRPIKVKSPDWVAIIAEKDGKFMMVKQLRHGSNKEFEEFPCGVIEENEDAIDAGIRELEEETGIKILDKRSVHYLGKFATNPGFMTNHMHYIHVNLDYAPFDVIEPHFDEHEHLVSYEVEKTKAFDNFIKSEGSALMGNAWMLLMKTKRFYTGD